MSEGLLGVPERQYVLPLSAKRRRAQMGVEAGLDVGPGLLPQRYR